jgi:hypothetical protein
MSDAPLIGMLPRRAMLILLLVGVLALGGCSLSWPFGAAPLSRTCRTAYQAANQIAAENTCPGTSDWRRDRPKGADSSADGFIAPASVVAGAIAHLYVTTTASSYTYAIYRMGYYQGLGGRLIYQSPSITGQRQPAPTIDPVTRMVECHWTNPATIATQRSWVSGSYLIKLISSDGYENYTFFVLRDPSPRAAILYTLPFTTYAAYNLWGGYSLYYHRLPDNSNDDTERSYVVSFDRPYRMGDLYYFGYYDLPLLSWMESQSYNLTYVADFDLDAPTIALNAYKLIVSSGHAEYWSAGMRASVTRARDAGVSLAFFGGNQMYWQVRFEPSPLGSDRRVVCYRVANLDPLASHNPKLATVRWQDPPLNQPSAPLLGQGYGGILLKPQALTLSADSAPYLTGTGLTTSSSLPGLMVGEYDKIAPNEGAVGVRIIATSIVLHRAAGAPGGALDISNATIYTAPSGAKVFDAGTFGWSLGLSPIALGVKTAVNSGFQRLTANILAALLAAGK